jgi:hypothetical protein
MLFQLKKLPEIINLTRFLKSFWILYIDQIIVYNAYALFCLSFCLRLNLTPVNYLTTRRSSMAKRQGSILSFFGNVNGPTNQFD